MKNLIKNLIVFSILMLTIAIVPFTVMAANDKDLTSFNITSGIDVGKNEEFTFDIERTITGNAKATTAVSVYVYNAKDLDYEVSLGLSEEEAKQKIAKYYEINVGASGIFSQVLSLAIGENTIEVTVRKEGVKTVTNNYIINRKKYEIKKELEDIIVLPGWAKKTTENVSLTMKNIK